jgi:glyoxylase-like metal-dependent hydrolase (beta-lactamase superfamily II)
VPEVASTAEQTYEVHAVRFGTLPSFPVRSLVAGADRERRMDIALMVWLARGPNGKNVLIDAGFHRPRLMQRWMPTEYERPDSAVHRAGIPPEAVTDIIVSHVHWDHMDGIDLFPNARVWIQRDEYEYYVAPNGTPAHSGIEPENATILADLRARGRVMLVEGDAQEPIPGIRVYTGGRHTWQSQFAGVRTSGGTVVIASDNLYLYENLDTRTPIAQTLDAAANLAAQDRMRTLASDARLIVPGHDPAVFARFEPAGSRVVRIR